LNPQKIIIDTRHFIDDTIINIWEFTSSFPIPVKRVYSLIFAAKNIERGNHAHLNQDQIIYVLSGKVQLTLTDKLFVKHEFTLENNSEAILIPSGFWLTLTSLEPSVVICFASQLFNDLETVTDINNFLK
jgi:dTDP-4-dehydrorhamnose 3,5-epimerase-like enzyme